MKDLSMKFPRCCFVVSYHYLLELFFGVREKARSKLEYEKSEYEKRVSQLQSQARTS